MTKMELRSALALAIVGLGLAGAAVPSFADDRANARAYDASGEYRGYPDWARAALAAKN